jgi:hypothetical protein
LVTADGGEYSSDDANSVSKHRKHAPWSEEDVGAVSSGLSDNVQESSSDAQQGEYDKGSKSADQDDDDQHDDDDEGGDSESAESDHGGRNGDASGSDGDVGGEHGKSRKEMRRLNVGENQHIVELRKKWKENEMHALKWYRRAAKLGHPWAIVMAADCYARYVSFASVYAACACKHVYVRFGCIK